MVGGVIAPTPPAELKAAAAEVHHGVPRCLLRLRDRADSCADPLSAKALATWMDYECEALRFGVDPDTPREELAAMIYGSTVEIPRQEHRAVHAGDFARWGRRGGLATASRYGTAWMTLLARRRWERITAEALAEAFAAIGGGRS
jgi:hypothetical protein